MPSRAGPRHAEESRAFFQPLSRHLVGPAIFLPSLRASETSILVERCYEKHARMEVQSMPAQRPTRVSAWLGLVLGLAQAHSGLARLGSGLAGSRLSSAQPGLTRLGPPRLIPCRLSSVPGYLRHLCFHGVNTFLLPSPGNFHLLNGLTHVLLLRRWTCLLVEQEVLCVAKQEDMFSC